MVTVEFFYSDSFSILEILAFTELLKSKQKHTQKLLVGLLAIKEEAIILPNRLQEGDQFKEVEIFEQAQKIGTKVYRRLSYGSTWKLSRQGYYLSFVFPNSVEWKEIIQKLLSSIFHKNTKLFNGYFTINNKKIGTYGTYSDPINTTVECYIFEVLNINQIREATVEFFENENELNMSAKLSVYDENLLTSIINGKFSTDSWIIECRPPFLEGKCLIELLVAYPPTRYCKAFISNTKQAITELNAEDKTELVVYERGKRGQMLRHMISKGILTAFKSHRLPALVINGNLKAAKEVPPVEKIKEYLTEELHKLNLL